MKANKEYTQGIEKTVTQALREVARLAAKKSRSKFTEKVPAFRFPAAHKAKRYVMENS